MKQKNNLNEEAHISTSIQNDAEKLKPLFTPCYLFVLGTITLLGINLIDEALLESANWKQNTIFGVLLLFGLIPSYVRNKKETWLVLGYTIAFFLFGGSNVIGSVAIALLIVKIFLPVFILFQTFRIWSVWKFTKRWLFLLPLIALIAVALIFPIEDKNIVESGWKSLSNWSFANYRSDGGFHIYLGVIGIVTGITEFFIVKSYIFNSDSCIK
jgi:hypothetical protein